MAQLAGATSPGGEAASNGESVATSALAKPSVGRFEVAPLAGTKPAFGESAAMAVAAPAVAPAPLAAQSAAADGAICPSPAQLEKAGPSAQAEPGRAEDPRALGLKSNGESAVKSAPAMLRAGRGEVVTLAGAALPGVEPCPTASRRSIRLLPCLSWVVVRWPHWRARNRLSGRRRQKRWQPRRQHRLRWRRSRQGRRARSALRRASWR